MSTSEPPPLRVLYAEDARLYREAMAAMLSSAGHNVVSAEDGIAAWDLLMDDMDNIDVFVTDHDMPGLTGLELVAMLRQTTFKGRIYVYSSILNAKEMMSYQNLRVDGIFLKDSRLEQIVRAIATRPSTWQSTGR